MICNWLNAIMLCNMMTLLKTMKTKFYIYSQFNYFFRTANKEVYMKIFFKICFIIITIMSAAAQYTDMNFEYIEGNNLKKLYVSSNTITEQVDWQVNIKPSLYFHIQYLNNNKAIYYYEDYEIKTGGVFIYDKNLSAIKQISSFPCIYGDVLTFSNDFFYTIERFNEGVLGLFCYDIYSGKNLWKKELQSLKKKFVEEYELYKIWYDEKNKFLYVNYHSLPHKYEEINGVCQIISVDSDETVYSSKGNFLMATGNNNFDTVYLNRDYNLYKLQVKNGGISGVSEPIRIWDKKNIKTLRKNQRYIFIAPVKDKYIIGIETIKINLFAKFLFGFGYHYGKYEYFICDKINNELHIKLKFSTKLRISDVR